MIVALNNEGAGISSISRITGISKAHTINKLRSIADNIVRKPIIEEE
jgi:insertion element IS1 protein InsB